MMQEVSSATPRRIEYNDETIAMPVDYGGIATGQTALALPSASAR